eukprot:CFRG1852T1
MASRTQVFVPRNGMGHLHWYPGHMAKGMREMIAKLRKVDVIVEVHDARIPFSGRNPMLDQLHGTKTHVLLFNKSDQIKPSHKKALLTKMKMVYPQTKVLFTACTDNRNDRTLRNMLSNTVKGLLDGTETKKDGSEKKEKYTLMTVGIPNVGKSSLINAWRRSVLHKRKAAKVGNMAGVTRGIQTLVTICEEPKVYAIDTPGIMLPKIDSYEMGMKLALVGCLRDTEVGEFHIAEYLLHCLNKNNLLTYVEQFGLDEPIPSKNIMLFLEHVGRHAGRIQKGNVVDTLSAASLFIGLYRKGKLGLFCLDDVSMPKLETVTQDNSVPANAPHTLT